MAVSHRCASRFPATVVAANLDTSSKSPRFIRHRRRSTLFSTPNFPGRARGPCPTKISCRAAPMCAAVQRTSCNVSLRGRTAPVAIRASRLRSCLRRLSFFLRRKKERKERRQNQWFWNPFRGQDTARSGTLQPRELSTAKFAPCFCIVSASPSATRAALVLAWRDGGNLCVCRGAA